MSVWSNRNRFNCLLGYLKTGTEGQIAAKFPGSNTFTNMRICGSSLPRGNFSLSSQILRKNFGPAFLPQKGLSGGPVLAIGAHLA